MDGGAARPGTTGGAVQAVTPGPGSAGLCQPIEHVIEHAAGALVIHLHRGIQPRLQLDLTAGTVGMVDHCLEPLPQLEFALQKLSNASCPHLRK